MEDNRVSPESKTDMPDKPEVLDFPEKEKETKPRKFSINPKILIIFFLTAFILIFLINNYIFIKSDIGIKQNENHFYRSIKYYDKLVMKGDVNLTHIQYPPLVYLVTTCFYTVNGVSMETARLSLMLFAVIFLLSMFGIGYELGGYKSAFTVMALAAASPHVLDLSRFYFLDFPQTALTALSFYLLLKTDFYRNRKYSLLFGFVLAIAMLTKWSTAFFLAIPILWFLIPNIFRSKKSFFTFLIYLIPSGIMLKGAEWYLSNLEKTRIPLYENWLKYYLIFAVGSSLLCIILMYILEWKFKKAPNYEGSGSQAIINFGYLSSLFTVVAAPWFFWAGFSVRPMLPTYAYIDPRDISMNIPVMKSFLLTMINFSPILIIIGVVFLFFSKKNLLKNLAIPVSLILTSLIMLRMMYDLYRVILALVIFGAALGGYWVGNIKNRRLSSALAIFLVAISIVSMTVTGSTMEKLPVFQGADTRMLGYSPLKLFVSNAPEVNEFNFHPVLENVTYNDEDGWKNIAVYSSDSFPGDINDIFVNAYVHGKKFNSTYCWQDSNPELFQEHVAHANNGEKQDFDNIDDLLIIHLDTENPRKIADRIHHVFFNDVPVRKKTYRLSKRWRVTNLKIDRHQIWARKRNQKGQNSGGM